MKKAKGLLETLKDHSEYAGSRIALCDKFIGVEGKLTYRTINGVARFYAIEPDGTTRYLGKDKEARIRELALKRYAEELKQAFIEQFARFEKCNSLLKSPLKRKVSSILKRIPEPIRRYIDTSVFTNDDEKYAQEWQKKDFKGWDNWDRRNVDPLIKSEKRETLRSKSERIITDMLIFEKIPYRYETEFVMKLGEETIFMHPDFYVLNKRTREEFFWEHCGRIDDPRYAENFQRKLEDYAKAGVYPGENLILTFEGSRRPISTDHIKGMIEHYLK